MSDYGRSSRSSAGPAKPPEATETASQFVPRSQDEDRTAANAQIQRSLKAWRSASGPARAAAVPEGDGSPLPFAIRSRMEPKFGTDLADVRVHTGSESANAAKQMGARAFTVGGDVHFNAGEFNPGSKEGDKLLAHELTHVVQGQKSGVKRKAEDGAAQKDAPGSDEKGDDKGAEAKSDKKDELEVSDPNEPAEKEADEKAEELTEDEAGGDEEKGEEKKAPKDKKDKDKEGDGLTAGADTSEGKEEEKAEGKTEEKPKEEAPAVGAKLMRKVYLAEDPAKAEEKEAKPEANYPKTPEEYKAHIRAKFAGEIAELKQMGEEMKAQGGLAKAQTEKLKSNADRIKTLKEKLDKTDKEAKELKRLMTIEPQAGQSQQELLAKAQTLLQDGVKDLGSDKLKLDSDKKQLESIMQASMALAMQTSPEMTGKGRTLYADKIDQAEHAALEQLIDQAHLPTDQKAELMSMYRRELRVLFRDEIMIDEKAAEILYLRDLGISGQRTGPTVEQLVSKYLDSIGVNDIAESTPEQLEAAYQSVIGSSKKTNEGVDGTAGVKK